MKTQKKTYAINILEEYVVLFLPKIFEALGPQK